MRHVGCVARESAEEVFVSVIGVLAESILLGSTERVVPVIDGGDTVGGTLYAETVCVEELLAIKSTAALNEVDCSAVATIFRTPIKF